MYPGNRREFPFWCYPMVQSQFMCYFRQRFLPFGVGEKEVELQRCGFDLLILHVNERTGVRVKWPVQRHNHGESGLLLLQSKPFSSCLEGKEMGRIL